MSWYSRALVPRGTQDENHPDICRQGNASGQGQSTSPVCVDGNFFVQVTDESSGFLTMRCKGCD